MKKTKKLLSFMLVFAMAIAMLSGCGKETNETDTVRIAGLKGPTSIGMVKLFSDYDNGLTENKYDYTIVAMADEITATFLKGELDIVAVPANLASVLYNKSEGAVEVLGINTLGVLYICEKGGETVTDVKSLKGKTIFATGKGSTPEYALEYILAQNGLDIDTDVTIEWKSEPSETVAEMSTLDSAVALIPQPYVTVAQNTLSDLRVAISLTEEWDKLDNGSTLISAVYLARKDYVEKNPGTIRKFLEEVEASTAYCNENVEETATLVENYGIVKAAIAKKAIPNCNIVCITGDDMITKLKGYLEILYGQNSAAVGGTLPADDFYYNE